MKAGDIVLTPIPQADGQVKNRPALLLCQLPPFDDLLVCGVSTQLRHEVVGFDETITQQDDDFAAIVQRFWNYCTVLRDDGLSYGDNVK